MNAHPLPEGKCPVCSYKFNACSPLPEMPDDPPKSGELTVCSQCKAILVYDFMLRPHLMDKDKISDKNLKELQGFIDEAL